MNRFSLITGILLTIAVTSGAYRYHDPPASEADIAEAARPAKPRHWTWPIPGWQPTTARRWERMTDAERMRARRDDRSAVARAIGSAPDYRGRPVVNLLIRLGKGQHRPGSEAWRDAMLDALESVGIVAEWGGVEYEGERGVSRGDIGATVELKEARQ